MFYFYFFLGLFILEIAILAVHFAVETYEFKIFFVIVLSITGIATILFLREGLSFAKRISKTTAHNKFE